MQPRDPKTGRFVKASTPMVARTAVWALLPWRRCGTKRCGLKTGHITHHAYKDGFDVVWF